LERSRSARAAEVEQRRSEVSLKIEDYATEVRKRRELRKAETKEVHEKIMSDAMERISKMGEE
jgi:hypothetical protein